MAKPAPDSMKCQETPEGAPHELFICTFSLEETFSVKGNGGTKYVLFLQHC